MEKVRVWNINDKSLVKIIYEESQNFYIFYLPCPEADYCLVVHKEDLTPINKMNLMNISTPGELIVEDNKEYNRLMQDVKQLKKLNLIKNAISKPSNLWDNL